MTISDRTKKKAFNKKYVSCSICLCNYDEDKNDYIETKILLECGHAFHKICLCKLHTRNSDTEFMYITLNVNNDHTDSNTENPIYIYIQTDE